MESQDRDPATGMRFGEKIRTYLLGVGVGIVLVGMLLYARYIRYGQQQPSSPPTQLAPTPPDSSTGQSPARSPNR